MTHIIRWFSAKQIASMKLVGLPTTERGILNVAAREGWNSRKRKGRGGGREYRLADALMSVFKIHLEADFISARYAK